VRESTGLYPRVRTDAAGSGVVSHAGAVLLLDTVRAAGLDRALSGALSPERHHRANSRASACRDGGMVVVGAADDVDGGEQPARTLTATTASAAVSSSRLVIRVRSRRVRSIAAERPAGRRGSSWSTPWRLRGRCRR
jgi:hypothetical protein